jgi:myo-inositol 2-dehydrogenase/D-chiro-inositol 1-dehydrogenase
MAAKTTLTAIMGRMATYSGKLVNWDEAIASELSLADTASLGSFDRHGPRPRPTTTGTTPSPSPACTQLL